MPQLWEPAADYAEHTETMRVLATHLLAAD
jgi:hypothetical protein